MATVTASASPPGAAPAPAASPATAATCCCSSEAAAAAPAWPSSSEDVARWRCEPELLEDEELLERLLLPAGEAGAALLSPAKTPVAATPSLTPCSSTNLLRICLSGRNKASPWAAACSCSLAAASSSGASAALPALGASTGSEKPANQRSLHSSGTSSRVSVCVSVLMSWRPFSTSSSLCNFSSFSLSSTSCQAAAAVCRDRATSTGDSMPGGTCMYHGIMSGSMTCAAEPPRSAWASALAASMPFTSVCCSAADIAS
mmetsp:Transcript_157803/g.278600  ORF Transcript_157803/g.278600 Transcript_157803/m.278600 type:complete len:259 (-) Transcript_157803:1947-2723(-)